MAALNLQTNDLPSQLHHALFELNGGRGYVLKPAEMLGEPGGGVAPNCFCRSLDSAGSRCHGVIFLGRVPIRCW